MTQTTPLMDIKVETSTRCRVIAGATKRLYYATPESVGLVLMRIAADGGPSQVNAPWIDYLADRGMALTVMGESLITLLTFPAQDRAVPFRKDTTAKDFTVKFPPLLLATNFKKGNLVKSQLWVIRPNIGPDKLAVGSAENILCYFPYGNVYNHGGICWGNTPIKDLRHPAEVLQAFFQSGFNGDLFAPSVYSASERDTLYGALTKVNNAAWPLPMDSMYTKSISALVQDIVRS